MGSSQALKTYSKGAPFYIASRIRSFEVESIPQAVSLPKKWLPVNSDTYSVEAGIVVFPVSRRV